MAKFILSADLETDQFDGPIVLGETPFDCTVQKGPDDLTLTGARNGHILEGCFRLIDEDGVLLDEIDVLIEHPETVWEEMHPKTREFHQQLHEGKGKSFYDRYHEFVYGKDTFVDEGLYRGFSVHENKDGERAIVCKSVAYLECALIEMLTGHIEDLKFYSYDNKDIIFVLGKSVRFDRNFFDAQMPIFARCLCHQTIDSSLFKVIAKLTDAPYLVCNLPSTHDARDDCISAEAEYKVWADFFKSLPKARTQEESLRAVRFPLYRIWLWLRRHVIGR